jgi:AcrR family transcriptional regulator
MPTRKRPYHHGDLRRTLLEASIELILERGLDALSLREVARRAGVSPAAPYHHFENRQQLLAALSLDGFRMLAEVMRSAREAASSGGALERFNAIGEAYVRFALAQPAHFRLMFRPSLVPSDAVAHDAAPREAFQVLLDAVSEVLQDSGIRAHIDQRGLTLVAWAIVHGASELLLDGPLANGLDQLDVCPSDVPALVTRAFGNILMALSSSPRAGATRKNR